ncbi:MAG: hypothetical protein JW903_05105 [Clostridia bacterium]|nr:hypothetical protein [Clostridia bacterium]
MKIITSWVSIALVLCLLAACIGILVFERSDDNRMEISEFEFSLTFGPNGRNSINTFTNLITKDLVADGVIATKYVMSDRDRRIVREMFQDMDILAYPQNLNVRSYWDHIEIINFHVVIDGKEHSIFWTVPWDFSFDKEDRLSEIHLEFIEFITFIKNLVINSDEYKALPNAKGGYL